jgi:hypothetical protein
MITLIQEHLMDKYKCSDLGAYYDAVKITQLISITPRSELVIYKARRNQDHSHSKPWDHFTMMIVDGVFRNAIPVPH